MTMETVHDPGVAAVRRGFEAFARGDLVAFRDAFHEDATWNHRNDDRFEGIHDGIDAIVGFIAESVTLTGGTLRAEPQAIMSDGGEHVAVLVRMTGTRPDGRSFDNPQIMLFTIDGERVRSADQFVGDPAAVRAFWA
jgi:ketosteroid isomerase-like protein